MNTGTQPPPTPYEPPWWDGISFKPRTAATGAADTRAAAHATIGTRPPWETITDEMIQDVFDNVFVDEGTETSVTVYIGLGNSDDKLAQGEWAMFVRETRTLLSRYGMRIIGEWASASDAPWQNVCFCREIPWENVLKLRAALRALRKHFRQDSVAFAIVDRTELL
jgi:hypothetical protein